MSKALNSYLERYAEPETRLLTLAAPLSYDHVLVIPAYAETADFIKRTLGNIRQSVLLILVANAPSVNRESTQRFANELLGALPLHWQHQNLTLLDYVPGTDILLVDRCQNGYTISAKQGVGLARKIGFDLALCLIQQGIIKSQWIYTTDADASLPRDYFDNEPGSDSTVAARIFPFCHNAEPDLEVASKLYDLSLHYYVEGLRYCGSPYAYHSIGSTLSIHNESYAKVRGFPKKSAGEDFYMLNKLAKVGRIESLNSPEILVEARCSDRTPFGTGPAINQIRNLVAPVSEHLYYHPEIFTLLKNWLDIIPEIWPNRSVIDIKFLSRKAQNYQQPLEDCLNRLRVLKTIQSGLDQYKTANTFERYLHHWFDAFRTLKFIHILRDSQFNSVPAKSLVDAPFFDNINTEVRERFLQLVC